MFTESDIYPSPVDEGVRYDNGVLSGGSWPGPWPGPGQVCDIVTIQIQITATCHNSLSHHHNYHRNDN